MPLKKLSEGSKGGIKKGGVKRGGVKRPKSSKPSSVTLSKKKKAQNRRAKHDGNSMNDIKSRPALSSKPPSQSNFAKSAAALKGKIRTSSFSGNMAKSTNSQYHTIQNKGAYGGGSRKPQGLDDFKLKNWGDSDIFL